MLFPPNDVSCGAVVGTAARFKRAEEPQQIKCSISVMAGLVPAIHVVVQLYITRLSAEVQMLQRGAGKIFALLWSNHVDGREQPGHDGAD
jgi:hypothetical protein